VPKNPTFGNEDTGEGRNSFRKQSELQRVSSHQVLKKNPIQAKRVELDMTNSEVSLAQKSIAQQLLKSAD
jgi:hypothetical protein